MGVDWKADLGKVWSHLGDRYALQGNLDTSCLYMSQDALTERIRGVLDAADNRPGHIFNLGHGILPGTPRENVRHLVETVKKLSAR